MSRDDDIHKYIDQAVERAIDSTEKRLDSKIDSAIERAVGFYYEKTKDDIDMIAEMFITTQDMIRDLPTRTEFEDLKAEVKTIRQVVTATNQDLHGHERRITKLENTVYNA